jgi:hypothetical protein
MLADIKLRGQDVPLTQHPEMYCYFIPERELSRERSVAVLIWDDLDGLKLKEYLKRQNDDELNALMLERVEIVYRDMLDADVCFDDLPRSILIDGVGNIKVRSWDEASHYPDEWEGKEQDPEWLGIVEREVQDLREDLLRQGLGPLLASDA